MQRVARALGTLALPILWTSTVRADGPTVSGFVDFGYNYNLNKQTTNVYRGFDNKANTLTLQNAEVDLAGKMENGVGYQIDLMYGYDATLTHSTGFDQSGASNVQFDVQQAYVNFPCPITGANIVLGKFVTPFGVEVIESKDNYNISRGVLFNYAIPFTHTGVKLDKSFADGKYTVAGGLVNGWDNMQDNNTGKSLFAQVGTTVLPKTSILVGGIYGPEQATTTPSIEKNGRSLLDAIVKVTPTDKLTLIANIDYGVEEGAGFEPTASDDSTANWAGLGLHANYAFSDTLSAALRYENFDDEGSRLSGGAIHQTVQTYTATLQKKYNGVTYRAEVRQDLSSDKVFVEDDLTPTDSQTTVGLQVILPF
jgi:hypothetical protein